MDHRTHSSKDKIVLYPFCNCFRVKMLKLACVGMPVYWLDLSVSVEMKWNSHYTNAPVRMNLTKVLTVGGSITVWLVSSFTSLDSTASLLTIFSFLVRSSLFKLETDSDPYPKVVFSDLKLLLVATTCRQVTIRKGQFNDRQDGISILMKPAKHYQNVKSWQ